MPPTPSDSDTSYALDDDFGLDGLNLQISDAGAEDEAELEAYLSPGGDPDEDTDGVREADADEGFSDIEAELADFLNEALEAPVGRRRARGEPLWVGFDGEWVFDEVAQRNNILSIQLFVPAQPAISSHPDKRERAAALSRIIYARNLTPEGRPSLQASLRQLVDDALAAQVIQETPSQINVVGFGLRFDLGALGDFKALKTQIDSVSGKVATVGAQASMEYARTLLTGDLLAPESIGLHFIDLAAHVAPGTALRALGRQLGKPKLDIPPPYSIERMDEYLAADRPGFEKYAMRDAEIAVLYALRLHEFARTKLGLKMKRGGKWVPGLKVLPATASGLALKWCLQKMDAAGIDRMEAFGLHQTTTEAYHAPTKKRRTIKGVEPTPMRRIQEAFLTDCYAGGRNESFFIGPSPVGVWRDYDLAGAYSTGLVDMPLIDFENPRPSLDVEDYLGHVAGFTLVDFAHPDDTRFPVFAVSRGGRGLIFPLKGTAYATAAEIRVALDLGCRIKIRWGVIYPWRQLPGDTLVDGVPTTRLFGPFVKAARELRTEQEKLLGKESPEALAAKLYANGVYGKVCQSLRPKNVFDTRKVSSVRLKPSPITNPAIGAYVTGFIRAILAEILNRIPRERTVLSVTTDGFLCDMPEDEMAACLTGPLCRRFQALCEEIVPGSKMLEVKHEVAQVVCMKTRGQLTGLDLQDRKIVLAKAGVQVAVKASNDLDGEAYKRLQNEKMLNVYLDRRPGKKILLKQFPAIRDQWEKGIDLFKFEKRLVLSLEPDLKRAPCNPRMIDVVSRQRAHISLDTRPWATVEEFDSARATLDGWRRKRCLKTMKDWQSLDEVIALNLIRSRLRTEGKATLNVREGMPASDLLRRAFLRAYAHEDLGLTKTYSYPALARWLTDLGYPTKVSEPRSAKSQKVVLGCVPRTEDVMALFERLQAEFPGAELERLLAGVGGGTQVKP
jgi:hypothetical protein